MELALRTSASRIGQGIVTWESQVAPSMPDCLRLVAANLAALEMTAGRAGVQIQVQAPMSLLAAIPPVDDPRSRVPARAPAVPGWTIERFVSSSLRWTTRRSGGPKISRFQGCGTVPDRTISPPDEVPALSLLALERANLYRPGTGRKVRSSSAAARARAAAVRSFSFCFVGSGELSAAASNRKSPNSVHGAASGSRQGHGSS